MSEPSTLQVLKLAEKIECSERLVYYVLKEIREGHEKASKEFNQLKNITSVGLYLQWFMTTHMVLGSEMKAIWQRHLNKINITLENLRVEFGLDAKGVIISEDD